MKIEKLRKNHNNKIIVGSLIGIGVIGAVTILPSFAKYRLTQSINIANGTINYKVPDLNMIAMYKSDNGENYTEIEGRMPDSGYIINEEKSYCNLNGEKDTNAILKTINGDHTIANLTKGDKCYLYFDKDKSPAEKTLASLGLTPSTGTPNFSKTSCTSGCGEATVGIYKTEDGMYDNDSYYFRGNTENNYVKFANFCWRIVRINGDGSIRLIYDGTTCHANGTSTAESIAKMSIQYNASYNQSNYVGWTYTGTSQRTTGGTASNAKTQLESWYSANITGTNATKVADGKYCNDRDAQSGSTWTIKGSTFYYAPYKRISDATPSLSCPSGDVYTLKVGLITADEAMLAGGKFENNTSYYLYNGQNYWTMSPFRWNSGGASAIVFFVDANGYLNVNGVRSTYGLRPVINMASDTQFKEGTNGTLENPYEDDPTNFGKAR